MKRAAILAAAVLSTMLGGCVVAPLEPVYVGAPAPAAVVVHPAPRYYHRYHGRRHRHW